MKIYFVGKWLGLDQTGLDRTGPDWTGLDWIKPDWNDNLDTKQ